MGNGVGARSAGTGAVGTAATTEVFRTGSEGPERVKVTMGATVIAASARQAKR